jgi:hypothetical protein
MCSLWLALSRRPPAASRLSVVLHARAVEAGEFWGRTRTGLELVEETHNYLSLPSGAIKIWYRRRLPGNGAGVYVRTTE